MPRSSDPHTDDYSDVQAPKPEPVESKRSENESRLRAEYFKSGTLSDKAAKARKYRNIAMTAAPAGDHASIRHASHVRQKAEAEAVRFLATLDPRDP